MLYWHWVILPIDQSRLEVFIERAQAKLEAEFNVEGYCEGELSSSALSTAVSCIALNCFNSDLHDAQIAKALLWLEQHVNSDGGWGDTVNSPSNVSTSLLCWAALKNADWPGESLLERYLIGQLGGLQPEDIVKTLSEIYGKDKTFAVPICMALAISGRLGSEPECWNYVEALPFEGAAAPASWYQFLNLSVVSYAIPALISIGILKHIKQAAFVPLRWIRAALLNRCLVKLAAVQPSHGGYLEAVPLTAFTAMALFTAGFRDHIVVKKAQLFLLDSMREDGSSPIDTNLATWLTSLSLQTLATTKSKMSLLNVQVWLSSMQTSQRDPYAGARAGAWAWTPLPGGVPDADDTSAALLALMASGYKDQVVLEKGVKWLLQLQNRDGGMPTFCRGWGQLPFDQSCSDITAHALRVFEIYSKLYPTSLSSELKKSQTKAWAFLKREQRQDGSWLPLWFGSQDHPQKSNPVYGTSKVLLAFTCASQLQMCERGVNYLLKVQQSDGGFGGHAEGRTSIEETALALNALLACNASTQACERAFEWLYCNTNAGKNFKAAPIGLYFASLWYSEKLYPILFALEAALKLRLSL